MTRAPQVIRVTLDIPLSEMLETAIGQEHNILTALNESPLLSMASRWTINKVHAGSPRVSFNRPPYGATWEHDYESPINRDT